MTGFLVPEAIRAELLAAVTERSDPFRVPTSAERVAHRARTVRADAAVLAEHERLLAASAGDSTARAVLAVHCPEGSSCAGDASGGYEDEPPDWPCRTVLVVARQVGVELAEDVWWQTFTDASGDCPMMDNPLATAAVARVKPEHRACVERRARAVAAVLSDVFDTGGLLPPGHEIVWTNTAGKS